MRLTFQRLAAAGCLLVLHSTPSGADWQYTHWGMHSEDVLKASNGQFDSCPLRTCLDKAPEGQSADLIGEYKAGPFAFIAYALFDKSTDRLVQISLSLQHPDQALALVGALRSKYGEPARHGRTAVSDVYVWRTDTDEISLLKIGDGPQAMVNLDYRARLTDQNKGL